MFFSRKEKDVKTETKQDLRKSSDKIEFAELEDNDKQALELVRKIKDGIPLIVNFQKLDEVTTNKFIPFFQGAVVALDGKTVLINEDTYLFSVKDNFYDGSLKEFIESIPRQ